MADMNELRVLLSESSTEDRANLAKLTDAGFGDSVESLTGHFVYLRAGTFGQMVWPGDYKQLVTDVADHVQIDWSNLLGGRTWHELTTAEIEGEVVATVFSRIFDQLPIEERRRLAVEIGNLSRDPGLTAHLMAGGTMLVSQLSGFQVYVLATTVIGAMTNALGIALPFVFYTTLSKGIAILIGPIGWAALGLAVLFKLNQPNWKKLLLGVVYVATLRGRSETVGGKAV